MYYHPVTFEFDPRKAAANLRKHGVSFAEAASGETRYLTVGTGALGRVLKVCWTERGSAARVISARLATARERRCYES